MSKEHSIPDSLACIPMRSVGPLRLTGAEIDDEIMVPLATFETPLWPSVNRGAAVTRAAEGISVVIVDDRMTRSILLQAPTAAAAARLGVELADQRATLARLVGETSRFGQLLDVHTHQIGDLLWVRLELSTGDASGHNMVTLAADRIMSWLLDRYPELTYGSISGNFCIDKKVSSVNSLMGRGKYTIAECHISDKLCRRFLKTTPERLVQLHVRKNLLGTIAAGGVQTANAHFANMLLAIYLATGQDAANIIEGSQGIVHAEVRGESLYFSVTLPNIIVGTVGNGKGHPFVQENLQALGCLEHRPAGGNARRLAAIVAGAVLCGEISLLAAQTNPGELMRAHVNLER